MELDLTYLELKYCERCGGLWLRPQGVSTSYCESCSCLMRELPQPGRPLPVRSARLAPALRSVLFGLVLPAIPGLQSLWGCCA